MTQPFYKSVTEVSKIFFMDPINVKNLLSKLKNSEVIIVRQAIETNVIRRIVFELLANPPGKSSDSRIIEGIENIY